MKKIILLAAVAILPLLVSADEAKFGYINTTELLQMMPEVSQVETHMAEYTKKNREYLEQMYTELQSKYEALEKDKATLTDTQKKLREEEIQALGERFQNAQQSLQEDVQKEYAAQLEPIRKRMQDAIESVAKKQGLTFVFNLSVEAVIYKGEKAIDITAAVKKELGIL